jgi:predicted dehydrogenase
VIGTGFMGRVHLEALRRVENVDVVEIAATSLGKARAAAAGYNVLNATGDWQDVIRDPSIEAVHITTPQWFAFSHRQGGVRSRQACAVRKAAGDDVAEAQELVTLQAAKKLRGGLCHNLRYYPMVQQMRRMREAGEFGEILVVQGHLFPGLDAARVRLELARRSQSQRSVAGDGRYRLAFLRHGRAWSPGCASHRYAAISRSSIPPANNRRGGGETFSGKLGGPSEAVDTPIVTEDFGATLFRMGRARGTMTASQVSAGRKNGLVLEIYGTKGGATWRQECPEELWLGHRDAPNQVLLKDPSLMNETARAFADYPGGHAEGYPDTFKQLFRRFYASIRDASMTPDYPQMADGLRQLKILEAELASHKAHAWVDLAN